jgi:dihydrofolate reductase
MSKPRISAIAAIGQNRELGKHNDLIWRIPNDLKRVRELTTGNSIIMGRKTYESIGRALPNRLNIVVSRNQEFSAPGCTVVASVEEAIECAAAHGDDIFIFGGAAVYAAAFAHTTRLYLTVIAAQDPDADTFFPKYEEFTQVLSSEEQSQGDLHYTYLTLERSVA